MYHSINILIKQGELYNYFNNLSMNYNNMINTTNYHIRQCMTGLAKDESDRFPNEKEVVDNINKNINSMNQPCKTKNGKIKKTKSKKPKSEFKAPTKSRWFKGYSFWNKYFQITKNEDYFALPGQVNQQAIKDCIESWTGYFSSLKKFKKNSTNYTGKPKIPHYQKPGSKATVTLSNQICKIKNNILRFPKTNLTLNLGNNKDYLNYKLAEVKIKPVGNNFEVILTFDDEKAAPEIKEISNRIIGIDLGIDNIAAISNNIGLHPIIIKGNVIKSYNQWFNKKNSNIQSDIDKCKDESLKLELIKQRNNLFDYRRRFLKDIFSKISNYIINYCIDNNIDTIIIGKNTNWKQNSHIGKKNNQTFCYIPHQSLIFNLQYRAEANGIKLIFNEESYTSKASFLDNDYIPTFKENTPTFSGRRIKRGLYKSKNGILINADINGASNIIKKTIPTAFNNIKDFSYLYTSTLVKRFHDFNKLPKYKMYSE